MSKKVKIIGCVAVLVTGLTGSAQDLKMMFLLNPTPFLRLLFKSLRVIMVREWKN